MASDTQMLLTATTGQAVTTTVVSTNAIALNAAGRDIAKGEAIGVTFQTVVDPAHAGTETLEFQVCTSTDADKSTGQVVLVSSGTIATATLAGGAFDVGKKFTLVLPTSLIPATATHLYARWVSANSGAITQRVFIEPLSMSQQSDGPVRRGFTFAPW